MKQRNDKLNWFTLSFASPLETLFRHDYFQKFKRAAQIGIIAGLIHYSLFGFFDALIVPESKHLYWFVRYAMVAPCFVALYALSITRYFERIMQPAVSLMVLIVGLGIIIPAAVSPPSLDNFYYTWAGLILTMMYCHVFSKLRFCYAFSTTSFLFVLYLLLVTTRVNIEVPILASTTMFVVSANLIGMFSCYSQEIYVRRDFIQRQHLEIAEKTSEGLLLNILPASIADRLKAGQVTIAESHADVTVLFADISGFSSLVQQLPPTRLVSLMNSIFSLFDALADRHSLEKIKTVGDAYMVVGGLPDFREDHVEAIADLALDMQSAIGHFDFGDLDPLMIRIGINTGPVVAGVIGKKRFAYDLWGDTVNMASRMESHGLAGRIQVTAGTYERLRRQFVLEERGMISIKGRGEMKTYFLNGRKETLVARSANNPG